MDWIEIAGLFGAFLTSVTFIPQVYKAWQTKSVGDLSATMLAIIFLSTVVWLVYAIALVLWPVIIANTVVCVLNLTLIYFKFSFK